MEGKINFNRNLVLSKEELDRFYTFSSGKIHAIQNGKVLSDRKLFPLVVTSTDLLPQRISSTTLKVNEGYIVNLNHSKDYVNHIFETNVDISALGLVASTDYYIVIQDSEEVGYELDTTASVTSTNQLTLNGNAGQYLRDMSGLDNIKVKFYKDSGLVNTEVYDIVNEIDTNNFIISGNLITETDLRIVIVGTYDLEKVNPTTPLYSFRRLSVSILNFTTNQTTIDQNAVLGTLTTNGDGTDYTVTDLRHVYDFNTIKFEKNSDFANENGATIESELKAKNNLHLDSNVFFKFTDKLTLNNSTLTIPASTEKTSDFNQKGSLYYITSGSSSTISRVVVNGNVRAGMLINVVLDNQSSNNINIDVEADYTIENAIYSPSAANTVIKKGMLVSLMRNGYGSWFVTSNVGTGELTDEQVDTLTNGGNADALHTHNFASYFTELEAEVLTNDGNADSLHYHPRYLEAGDVGSDITDLSLHSVTELSDISSAGSGDIITSAERSKLSGIETGAEVNNISDTNATDLTDGGTTTLHNHNDVYYTQTQLQTSGGASVNKENVGGFSSTESSNFTNVDTVDATITFNGVSSKMNVESIGNITTTTFYAVFDITSFNGGGTRAEIKLQAPAAFALPDGILCSVVIRVGTDTYRHGYVRQVDSQTPTIFEAGFSDGTVWNVQNGYAISGNVSFSTNF